MAGDGQTAKSSVIAARVFCFALGAFLVGLAFFDTPVIGGGEGFGLVQMAVLAVGLLTVVVGLLPAGIAVPYLFLLISTIVTLVAAEMVLRTVLGAKYYTAYAYDPRYLFKLEPGASREYANHPANGGGTVVYQINSDGFRGPELETAGAKPRIMVYGDSFIHAEYSELADTFPVQLQARLSERHGAEAEVINAGVAGYGPDQILRRMEDELAMFKPDLVLVALFSGNDFGDLLRNRLYRLSEDDALIDNAFRLSEAQQRQIALNRSEPILRKMLKDAIGRVRGGGSEEFAFDKRKWIEDALAQHVAEYEAYVVGGDNTVGAFGIDPYSADIALLPESPSAQYKKKLLDPIVGRMKEVAAVQGVPLAVMIIPHPVDLLDGDHSSGRIDKVAYPAYDPTRLSDAMFAIIEKHGIAHLNLFPVFRNADVNALFLKGGDDHWNAAGQRFAAQAVAAFLAENGLLGAAAGQ